MENAINSSFTQVSNQFLSQLKIWQKQIKHVIRLLTMIRNTRQLHIMFTCPILEACIIDFPYLFAMQLNFLALFELGKQKRGENIRGQIGRTYIHPGIFIHLTAKEA